MSSPGTLRFGQVNSTPSPPPSGYDLIYVKLDDILYIQDSSGVETAIGTASGITQLTGDVSATGPGSVIATVNSVGGVTASNVASGANAANAATPSNTPSTIVLRNGSGNFSAGTITASLNGNASTSTNATTAVNFTGSLSGDVTGTQSATSILSTVVTGKILTGYVVGINSPILATDSILGAFEKVQGQLNATSSSAITALTGDGTATGPGSVPFTLATVNSNIGTFASVTVNGKGLVTGAGNLSGDATTSGSVITLATVNSNTGSFGSSTSIPSFTVNAKGLITAASGNVVVAPAGTLTGTTLNSTVVSSSLTSVGTITSGTWNGTTLAINHGGTGQTTATAAFAALSPLTNAGDIIYENSVPAPTNLPIGTTGQLLTVVAGLPAWQTFSSGSLPTITLTGNVTGSGSGGTIATTIANNVVTNAMLSQMPPDTLKGNNTGSTANASDLTVAQVSAMVSGTPITQTPNNSNAPGVAGTLALSDHIHNIPTATPVQIGTSNSQGSAASFSNSDHIHAHGAQTDPTLHAVATDSVNGFMSAADKTKLDASTALNTPNTLVLRDSSGNFAAGTITANLTGNASGSSSTFTGSLSGDITGTQTTTNVAKIQGTTVSGTTGSGNVVFSASPTFTGTILAAAATFSAQLSSSFSSTTAVVLNTTSFIFDTVNNSLGIGTQPLASVMIDGVNTTGASKLVQMTGYGTGSTTGYRGRFARGTLGSPSAVQAGDNLSAISGRGYGTSQFATVSTGVMNIVAGETFTNTSNATYLTFNTTPTGSVTSSEAMRINTTSNVLIGTTTDNANDKLQVNGGVTITNALKITTFALTDGANIATDASKSNTFTVTLAGNRNLSAPTNPTDGQKITYRITQDATGGRTLTFDPIFTFGLDIISVVLSTGASKTDYIGCIYNGATSKWNVVAVSKGF